VVAQTRAVLQKFDHVRDPFVLDVVDLATARRERR